MISQLIGGFSIFLGILWLIWPQILRGWAVNRTSGMIYWPVVFSIFFPLTSWAGKRWGTNGWIGVCLAFFIIGTLLKAVIRKGAEKIPLYCFRIVGILNVMTGLYLIYRQ